MMSLVLYLMCVSKRVNMKILRGGPIIVLQLLSYVSSRRRRRRRKDGKMGKILLDIIFTFGAFLLRFLVYCLVFT